MPRVNFAAVRRRSVAQLNQSRKEMVGNSIRRNSGKTYASSVRSLTRVIAIIRGDDTDTVNGSEIQLLSVTKDEMMAVLATLHEQKIACGGAWVAALKKELAKNGQSLDFLDDDDLKASVKGVKRAAAAAPGRKPCGTLSVEQFEELKNLLRKKYPQELFYVVVIAFLARLRIGELAHLKHTDAVMVDDVCLLTLRQWKQGDGGDQDEVGEQINPVPKVLNRDFYEVFQAVVDNRFGSNGYLFSKTVDKQLRDLMPQWASELGWADTFRYSGPHVFRHGGCQHINAIREKIADAVLSVFAQQTTPTFNMYSASEATRKKRSRED